MSESGELIIERDALVAFYQRHDASKIDNVDQALSLFSAEEIVETLKEKYGEAPPTVFRRLESTVENTAFPRPLEAPAGEPTASDAGNRGTSLFGITGFLQQLAPQTSPSSQQAQQQAEGTEADTVSGNETALPAQSLEGDPAASQNADHSQRLDQDIEIKCKRNHLET